MDCKSNKKSCLNRVNLEICRGITVKTLNRIIKKLEEDGVVTMCKGKMSMTLEQYRLGQRQIHHYVEL